jgi:hypothetical protein
MGQRMLAICLVQTHPMMLIYINSLDGPIFSLKLGNQTLVVLSSADSVKDLLDKRSGIYSGRPPLFIRDYGDDLNILMRT